LAQAAGKATKIKQAFWTEFMPVKFRTVPSFATEMYTWGKLVNLVKSTMPDSEVQWLRNVYIQEKQVIDNFKFSSLKQHKKNKYGNTFT
jgi:hypothetical protein